MPWGLSLVAVLIAFACAICAPANAQGVDQSGGDLQWVHRAPLTNYAPGAKTLTGGSADAAYSNLGTFRNQSYFAAGATQQFLNTITRLAADDLNLVGSPPYKVSGYRFTVTNRNAVDVSARMIVRFWLPDGAGGGPGTLIRASTFNPITFTAGVVGTINSSSDFVSPSSSLWAGIGFDNNGGATGATAEQLDNLGQGIFSPAEVGTSADQYFVTTAAGSFGDDNPVGTIQNFGGTPPADFGWEILTAQDVDLSITKSDGVETAFPGGSVTYTITASNAGPDTVFDARVVDEFPVSLTCTWTCAGSTGNTCAASGSGNINDETVNLMVGGSVTYTATCDVSPTATGTLVNTANFLAVGTAVESNPANNSATDTDTIAPAPDLVIAKGHTGDFIQGQPGTYSLTVSNTGGSPTSGPVTVIDELPVGLVPTSAAGTGWTCNFAGQGAICNRSDPLAASASYPPIALTVAVAIDAPASVTNTATVFGGSELDQANNTDDDPTTILAGPDLTLSKSHAGNFTQGQSGSYVLTVSNTGSSPTSGPISVTDNVPIGLAPTTAAGTGWTCSIAGQGVSCDRSDPLAPGLSYPTITLTVSVEPNAPASVTNTADVFGGGETDPSNNTATDPTTIAAGPDLTLAKSHTGNFTQGQTGTYDLAVSNIGGAPTTGTVTVSDSVPAGLVPTIATGTGWICNIATQDVTCTRSDPLAPGQIHPAITLTVSVQPTAPASVTNTATVSGGGDVDSSNDSGSDPTTIIAVADLTMAKSHTGSFLQGQVGATFTLTATNIGGGPTSGPVTVNDTLPAGLTPTAAAGAGWVCNIAAQAVTCSRGDLLGAGASYPAITLTVNVAPAAPPSLANTAQVSGGGEIDTANNTATDITTIGPGPDLTVSKSHTGNFTQGLTGTYTIIVGNPGSPSIGLITVTDNVPVGLVPISATGTGWICNLSGQDATCTRSDPLASLQSYPAITLTVNVQPGAPASVTNAVTVSGGGDVNPSNNSDTDVTTIGPGADLTITKSHTGNFTQGQTGASYTVTVTNSGVGPTTAIVAVADPLPQGLSPTAATGTGWTCTVGARAVGCTSGDVVAAGVAYPPITITLNVAANAPPTVTNIVGVSGGGDSNAANNTASDLTTIVPGPDLALTKAHTGTFAQGQSGTYTLTAGNTGGSTTVGPVVVTDNLPVGLVPSSAAGDGWTCTVAAQGAICGRSDPLAPGGEYPPITLTVAVAVNAPASVTNTAIIFGGGEIDSSNNTAADPTTIAAGPDLTLTKTHSGSFTQGQPGSYVLTVSNTGGSPTSGSVTITDNVPIGLAPTSAAGTGWTCTIAGQGVSCERSDPLAPGLSYPTITLTVSVAPNAPASVTNTADVFGGGETDPTNNAATDPTTIGAGPDLTLAKSHTGTFTQGQTGTYSLLVSNIGGAPTTGAITVTDPVPVGLVPTTATGTGWTCNVAAQVVTCNRGDPLAPGSSLPAITLAVSVQADAPASVTNTATVGGGADINSSNNTATDPTTITGGPDLTLAKSHTGNFTQGQTGTYNLSVSNIGGAPTTGAITVTDNVPSGLVPTTATGSGWTCGIAAQIVTCNRSDPLAPGLAHPVITLAVSVQPTAPASVTNAATVTGGSETDPSNNTATDPTTITGGPNLTLSKSHTGDFTQGQTGTYNLLVSNIGGAPTSGAVTVTDNVPVGLLPTTATGTGWTCNIATQVVTCNRSDPLAAGLSHPTISLAVSVQPTAPASVTNTATVSGGGDADPSNGSASDATTIASAIEVLALPVPTLRGWVLAMMALLVAAMGAGFIGGRTRTLRRVPSRSRT